jgi:translocator assembly and maintenance protein 41
MKINVAGTSMFDLVHPAVIQVKKIVEGSFQPFQLMYRSLLQDYISEGILKTSTYGQQLAFKQVFISFCSHALAQ